MRGDGAIQYAPLPPLPPPETPAWIKFLKTLLEPIGKALGMSWGVLQWLLLALAIAGAIYAAWRLSGPWRNRLPGLVSGTQSDDWAPEPTAALALLEQADLLAAMGDYDLAAHLLLQRSVEHIAASRPDWVLPASTAREIAAIGGLPEAARRAFGVIAGRVERSRFALTALTSQDWQAAREAYADFALTRIPGAEFYR